MKLTVEAKEYAEAKVSQTFYPNVTQSSKKGDRVDQPWFAHPSAGRKRFCAVRLPIRWLTGSSCGMLYIDSVTLKQ